MKKRKFKFLPEEVFIENSTLRRGSVREYILHFELLPYQCEECGIGPEWNGKKLVLQLEHKNGINNDNRLVNLCFLCPNCHSQTETFSGKNSWKEKRKRIYEKKGTWHKEKLESDRLLLSRLLNEGDIEIGKWGWKTQLAKKIGIRPQKVNKWLKRVAPS